MPPLSVSTRSIVTPCSRDHAVACTRPPAVGARCSSATISADSDRAVANRMFPGRTSWENWRDFYFVIPLSTGRRTRRKKRVSRKS